MKNRIIAAGVIAASILSYSSSSFAQTKTFPDVQTGHWAEDSINYLAEKGAVTVTRKECSSLERKSLVQKQLQ